MEAAIKKIKEAEEKSEAIIKKASESAADIAKTATATANTRKKAILDDAKARRAAILDKARQEAQETCVPLDKTANGDIERILHPDEAAFNAAVGALAERLAR